MVALVVCSCKCGPLVMCEWYWFLGLGLFRSNTKDIDHGHHQTISIGRFRNKSVSTQTILLNFPRQIPESTQGECQTSQKPFRRQLNRDMLVF